MACNAHSLQQSVQTAAVACIKQEQAGHVTGLGAIHSLTWLLAQAPSAQTAVAWAELAAEAGSERAVGLSPSQHGSSVSALVSMLLGHCASGEQHMVVALNCLILLAASRKVCKQLVSGGLFPILVAVLLGGQGTLEPVLQLTAVRLMTCLVAVDSRCLMHGCHAESLLSVVQHGLGSTQSALRTMCCDVLYQVLLYFQGKPAPPPMIAVMQPVLADVMRKEQSPQLQKRLQHCQQLLQRSTTIG